MGPLAWDLGLGIFGLRPGVGHLALVLGLWILALRSLPGDPWLGIFVSVSLALDLRLGISGFGSLALDLHLWVFGFGSSVWDLWLGTFGLASWAWRAGLLRLKEPPGQNCGKLARPSAATALKDIG